MKKLLLIIATMRIKILSLIIIALFSSMAFAQKIVWKPLASLPQATYGGEAVAYNNKIYFVAYSDSSYPNFYEYEILHNKWKTLRDLPNLGDAAAAEVDGKIYVISGEIPENTNTNFVYNPETNEWNSLALMPTIRKHFDCGRVNNKIYIMGGITSYDDVPSSCTRKNEVYDVTTNTWAEKAPVPTLRNNPAVVAVDSLIYIIGGAGSSSSIWQLIKTVECYNTNTDKWETKKGLPVATLVPGAVAVNKKVFVLGGQNESGAGLSSVYVYDQATDTWTKTTSLPKINVLAGLVAVDNKIYVIGGTESVAYDAPLYSDVYEGTVISEGNFIPAVYRPIPDTSIIVGENYTYKIPDFTFIDDDALTYSCKQSNGENLPAWLKFTPSTRTCSGTPLNAENLTVMVTVTDKENVTVYDEFQISVTNATNIKDKQSQIPKESMLYPNPTNGTITLSFRASQNHEALVEIYNLQGSQVFSKTFQNTTSATIDLTGNPKGIYMIKVIAGEKCYDEKILKE
jgi:N-acetylneuraminic acid mutarotase